MTILIVLTNGFSFRKKATNVTGGDFHVSVNVKIYSNLAEIIQPLGKLPLEFSAEDWSDIRSDSVTLVGSSVTITEQTITEKKKSLDNTQVYVRSPTSSNTETKFVKATLVDQDRNLVKLIDKDISKEPVFLTVSSDHIVYDAAPPQSKYYVNFTYDTKDAVYLSYLRSNLNWKTRYQLDLFDESKGPVLIAMADIRNDGQSKVDIEHAELLGGDINLQMHQSHRMELSYDYARYPTMGAAPGDSDGSPKVSVGRGEEVAGLYVFPINQPFSIDAKTNHLLPMFRPHVKVERYGSFSKYFYGGDKSPNTKAQRSYRLSSDRFLSSGNCIIRESDRLVGETSLPDIAAKDKYEFSIGQDADITLKENITLISKNTFNESTSRKSLDNEQRTKSVYNVDLTFKNFKKSREVNVEYQYEIPGKSLKLTQPNTNVKQEGSLIKAVFKLGAGDDKSISYKFELIS